MVVFLGIINILIWVLCKVESKIEIDRGYFPYTHVLEEKTLIFEKDKLIIRSHQDYSNPQTFSYKTEYQLTELITTGIDSNSLPFFAYYSEPKQEINILNLNDQYQLPQDLTKAVKFTSSMLGTVKSVISFKNKFYIFTIHNNQLYINIENNESTKICPGILFENARCIVTKDSSNEEKGILCAGRELNKDKLRVCYGTPDNMKESARDFGEISKNFDVALGVGNGIHICTFEEKKNYCKHFFSKDDIDNTDVYTIKTSITCKIGSSQTHAFRTFNHETFFIGCLGEGGFDYRKIYAVNNEIEYEIVPDSNIFVEDSSTNFDFAVYGVNAAFVYYFPPTNVPNAHYKKFLENNLERQIKLSPKDDGSFSFEIFAVKEVREGSSVVFSNPQIKLEFSSNQISLFFLNNHQKIESGTTIIEPGASFIFEKKSGQTSKEVQLGYYFTDGKGTVMSLKLSVNFICASTCASCYSGEVEGSSNCLTCQSGLKLINGNCKKCTDNLKPYEYKDKCYSECPQYTIPKTEDMKCFDCSEEGKYYLNGKCVDKCDDRMVIDRDNKACIKCSEINLLFQDGACVSSCDQYKREVDGICEECPEGTFLINGNCETQCPRDRFANEKKKICDSCEKKLFIYKNSCVTSCPVGTFRVYSQTCVDQCPKGFMEDNGRCLSCKEQGKFTYEDNCVNICPDDTESDEENNCRSCAEDKFYFENSCYSECPKFTYPDGRRVCVYCQKGKMLKDTKTCEEKVPLGYFISETDREGHILLGKCYENCKTCSEEGSSENQKCQECKDGLYLYERGTISNCVESCYDAKRPEIGLDLKTNKCVNCKENGMSLDENLHECYTGSPKGYYFNKTNPGVFLKCFLNCNEIKFKPQKAFCEDPDIVQNCYNQIEIDEELRITTVALEDHEKIKDKFRKKTDSEKSKELESTVREIQKGFSNDINKGIDKSILLSELIEMVKEESEKKNYTAKNIEAIKEGFSCKKIQGLYEDETQTAKTLVSIPLVLYLSISKKEKYLNETQLEVLQSLSSCVVDNGIKNYDKISDEVKMDFFEISTLASIKMLETLKSLPKIDRDFQEKQFLKNITYKYEKGLYLSPATIQAKKLVEKVSLLSLNFEGTMTTLNFTDFRLTSVTLDELSKGNYIEDGLFLSMTNCQDKEKLNHQINTLNFTVKICFPYQISTDYKEIKTFSVIRYKSYPLLNPNITDEVGEEFVSIIILDKDQKEIDINRLTLPIKIIIKKPLNDIKYCSFYEDPPEGSATPSYLESKGCESESLNEDYTICSCHHLTDFSLAKYDVSRVYQKIHLLENQPRLITSFDNFRYLNSKNAIVVYIISGILFAYLVSLGLAIYCDNKQKRKFFIVIKKREDLTCCDKRRINEIEGLESKLVSSYEGDPFDEEKGDHVVTEANQEIELQEFPQGSFKRRKSKIKSRKTSSNRTIIDVRRIIKNSNRTFYSTCKLFFVLFKEIFKRDYWLCEISLNNRDIPKANVLTIFCTYLIATLAFCSVFSKCSIKQSNGVDGRDIGISIGVIFLLKIPLMLLRFLLQKGQVAFEMIPSAGKIKLNTIYRFGLVYLFLLVVVSFFIINSIWISLDSKMNEIYCRSLTDFALSVGLNIVIFQVLFIFLKALVYLLLLRGKKESTVIQSLFDIASSLPCIFNL